MGFLLFVVSKLCPKNKKLINHLGAQQATWNTPTDSTKETALSLIFIVIVTIQESCLVLLTKSALPLIFMKKKY